MITRTVSALILLASFASAQTPAAVDTLFMNDAAGTHRVGQIKSINNTSFQLEVTLAVGGAKAMVTVPRSQVSRVEFAPNPSRDRLITNPVPANIFALGAEWKRWQPFLKVAKSPAGAIGIAYASALLATGDPKQAAPALELFKNIEREAWSDADQALARQGRLRALVATGHAGDAVAEAVEIAKEAEDPSVLIEAKFILAEAANAKLRKLVEDNPRWKDDPLVRSERERLYNEALDLYLHPYLFLGSETEAASRGLWNAVQVYRFGGDDQNAVESARDLVTLYAGTPQAKLAQDYLDKLPDALKNQNVEKDVQNDVEK